MEDALVSNGAKEFQQACANMRTYLELMRQKEPYKLLAQRKRIAQTLLRVEEQQEQSKDQLRLFEQEQFQGEIFVERLY